MGQLVEQRIFTPTAKAVRTHGCNPTQLCAIALLLTIALPGKLLKFVAKLGGCAKDDGDEPGCCETCCTPFMSFFSPVLAPVATLWARVVAARETAKKKVKMPTEDEGAGDGD